MQQRAQERWALFSLVAARHGGLPDLVAAFPRAAPMSAAMAHKVLRQSSISPAVAQHAEVGMAGITAGGAEWDTPVCQDTPIATGGDQITLTFHTSRTVGEMAPYADPRTWPACSAYWVAMKPMSMCAVTDAWAGAFEEVVEFVPGYPMVVPLGVAYTQTATSVHMDYWLLAPTSYLDLDEGSIDISLDPTGPADMPTRIVTVKRIHWKDAALQKMPHLVCDTYWGELGLNMASRCGL